MALPDAKTAAPDAAAPPADKRAAPPPAGADKGPAAASAAGSAFSLKAVMPSLAALILAPALTLGAVWFVVLPRLRQELNAPAPAAEAAKPPKAEKGKPGNPPPSYEFSNVVVNLAGTMGTRYLKTSFQVTGKVAGVKEIFDENKARLTDVTLNVLSSLTLADLEEPGSKNVLREKLVTAYNQALGRAIVDQVYFSDFVVQ